MCTDRVPHCSRGPFIYSFIASPSVMGTSGKNLFCSLFDCICPGLRQIPGKKSSGSLTDIILPSDQDLPSAAASSDCCHLGVIVCVIHLQIFTFQTEKWTCNRTSTSYEFFLAIVAISLIPRCPASALVWT